MGLGSPKAAGHPPYPCESDALHEEQCAAGLPGGRRLYSQPDRPRANLQHPRPCAAQVNCGSRAHLVTATIARIRSMVAEREPSLARSGVEAPRHVEKTDGPPGC